MYKVAVLDTEKKQLEPCHPAKARRLLKSGEAAVFRTYPFAIILKRAVPAEEIQTRFYTLGSDPGSRVSGKAITSDDGEIIFAAELHHRARKGGNGISSALTTRAGFRRGRRTRNLRYRPARWANRARKVPTLTENGWEYRSVATAEGMDAAKSKNSFNRVSKAMLLDKRYEWERVFDEKSKDGESLPVTKEIYRDAAIKAYKQHNKHGKIFNMSKNRWELLPYKAARKNQRVRWKRKRIVHKKVARNGWISPSLMSRVFNFETWSRRLCKLYPISQIAFENVKFDTQLLQNPKIHGIEYQHGTLHGREINEYLLELAGRKCTYCGASNVVLVTDHIRPKSRGGSSRPDNLCKVCEPCNQKKGNLLPGSKELEKRMGAKIAKKVKAAKDKSKKGLNLSDATAVNTIRWKLLETLEVMGLPVIRGTGGKTAYHRILAGLPKTHYYDAACVAQVCKQPKGLPVFIIQAKGYGQRDLYSFTVTKRKPGSKRTGPGFNFGEKKRTSGDGFKKFDHVELTKKKGVGGAIKSGKWRGTINCFDNTPSGKPRKVRVEYFPEEPVKDARVSGNTTQLRLIQKRDGYSYDVRPARSDFYERKEEPSLKSIPKAEKEVSAPPCVPQMSDEPASVDFTDQLSMGFEKDLQVHHTERVPKRRNSRRKKDVLEESTQLSMSFENESP